jgi:hypothetical protein
MGSVPRSPWAGSRANYSRRSDASLHLQIFSRFFAPVRDDVERDLVALAQFTQPGPLDRGDVNEHVPATTAVRLDEAITLGCVKPLHCPARHVALPFDTPNPALEPRRRKPASKNPPARTGGRLH